MSIWADNTRIELLKTLWDKGVSCSLIAAELGDGITRNAVIGKVCRLGLTPRNKNGANTTIRKPYRSGNPSRKSRIKARAQRSDGRPLAPQFSETPLPDTSFIDAAIPVEQHKTLLELNEDTCRWPVGDPGEEGFYFCGGSPLKHSPYCALHSRVAFQPMTARSQPKKLWRS